MTTIRLIKLFLRRDDDEIELLNEEIRTLENQFGPLISLCPHKNELTYITIFRTIIS